MHPFVVRDPSHGVGGARKGTSEANGNNLDQHGVSYAHAHAACPLHTSVCSGLSCFPPIGMAG